MGNKASKKSAKVAKKTVAKPVLLAGGNPQIAKADGDAPVQAYIAAMPGWTSDIGRRLDALTVRNVPHVRKAVKWNSPFYGIEGQGWFLNFHCFTKYVKVAFFRGTSVRPLPPGESKHKEVRYLDIHEDDQLDEAQFVAWVKQASQLPGEDLGDHLTGLKPSSADLARVVLCLPPPGARRARGNLGARRNREGLWGLTTSAAPSMISGKSSSERSLRSIRARLASSGLALARPRGSGTLMTTNYCRLLREASTSRY
jgi:hypothetical protein